MRFQLAITIRGGRAWSKLAPQFERKNFANCWKLWGFQVFLSNHNIASFHISYLTILKANEANFSFRMKILFAKIHLVTCIKHTSTHSEKYRWEKIHYGKNTVGKNTLWKNTDWKKMFQSQKPSFPRSIEFSIHLKPSYTYHSP